jgi:adenylosuccinate lyase
MIPRYSNPAVTDLCADLTKLLGWQEVELAVIAARVDLGLVPRTTYDRIEKALLANQPDVEWWKIRDNDIHHDLNAFIDERRRHLPADLQAYFHEDLTSYDTEEAAFALLLLNLSALIEQAHVSLVGRLEALARLHRYTPMLARTHGQWAKLRTFGSHVLTWLAELQQAHKGFPLAVEQCRQSRISGAVGNFGGKLTPEIERGALEHLRLTPFVGATQILPRVIYAELAQCLQRHAEELGKIALDIRLGARSGKPICHEPFRKRQMGSSAMPHKKNTIRTEQMSGMVRLVRGYVSAIVSNIETWEARAIEQSSVERVAWPDLVHTLLHMYKVMDEVIKDLVVYPDHMLQEIVEARGTYASDEGKNLLARLLGEQGHDAKVSYRIIQLASFCAFKPSPFWEGLRGQRPGNAAGMDKVLGAALSQPPQEILHIRDLIAGGRLFPVDELEAAPADVEQWNVTLAKLFADPAVRSQWEEIFEPSRLLKQEDYLFDRALVRQERP